MLVPLLKRMLSQKVISSPKRGEVRRGDVLNLVEIISENAPSLTFPLLGRGKVCFIASASKIGSLDRLNGSGDGLH